MSTLKGILAELRERRLWPVALALVVALVAVPVALTKGAPASSVSPSNPGLPISSGSKVPAITVAAAPAGMKLAAGGRDPFSQQNAPGVVPVAGGATTSTAFATGSSGGAVSVSAGGGGGAAASDSGSAPASGGGGGQATSVSTGGAPSSGGAVTTTTITQGMHPAPTTSGLSATQAYQVALSITNPSGGLDQIDPLERLSVLPGQSQPRLVELGVLQGGNQVLFVVQPGTVVSGPGTCTPGPIDCEILSLSQDQTEGISVQTQNGSAPVALMAVTGITAADYHSVAAATKARLQASPAGADLLNNSTFSSLSLFQYQPSIGAVVDLRNLTVEGS